MTLKNRISHFIRRMEVMFIVPKLKRKNKKILVFIGCGRSGTTFTATLLSKVGISIGHERLKESGVSSWYLVTNQKTGVLGPTLDDLKDIPKVLIHQVREPLAAVSSMLSSGKPNWIFRSREIPVDVKNDSMVLKAMKYYYYWNLKAEPIAEHRVQVEKFVEQMNPVLKANGFPEIPETNQLSSENKVNTRQHAKLTWDDLKNEDQDLYLKIIQLGNKYGYAMPNT